MGVRPGLACPCPAGTAEQGQGPGKQEERWSPIRVRPYAEAGIPGEQESAPLRSAQRGGRGEATEAHTGKGRGGLTADGVQILGPTSESCQWSPELERVGPGNKVV